MNHDDEFDDSFDDGLLDPHPASMRRPPAPPKPPAAPVLTTPRVPVPTSPSASKAARWTCLDCGTVWKKNPGPFHTHDTPVAGSKSRTTQSNHAITVAADD